MLSTGPKYFYKPGLARTMRQITRKSKACLFCCKQKRLSRHSFIKYNIPSLFSLIVQQTGWEQLFWVDVWLISCLVFAFCCSQIINLNPAKITLYQLYVYGHQNTIMITVSVLAWNPPEGLEFVSTVYFSVLYRISFFYDIKI